MPHAIQFSTKNNDIHFISFFTILFLYIQFQKTNIEFLLVTISRIKCRSLTLFSSPSTPSLNAYNLYLFFSTNNMHFLLVWLFKYLYLKNIFYILVSFQVIVLYSLSLSVLFRVLIFFSSFVAIFNEEPVMLQFSVIFYCFLTVFSFLSFITQKRKQSHYWFVFLIAIQR